MAKRMAINIGIGASVNSSMGKSMEQVKKEADGLGKDFDHLNRKLSRAKEVQKYERQLAALNKRMASGRGDTKNMEAVQAKLEKKLKQSQRAAKNAGVNVKHLGDEIRGYAHRADVARRKQDELNTSLQKAQRIESLKKATVGRAAEYGRGTRVGRGVTAMGGSSRLAAGAGLAAAGVTAAGAAAAAGATAAFAATARLADKLDVIGKQASKLGMTTDALQEMQFAAELSGVSAETMNMALQRQSRRIAEAAQGTGEAVNALEELGLSAEELNKLSPDEQMMKIADAMSQVKNANDKTRLSMKLWDSEGVALINVVNGGSEALKEMRKQTSVIPKEVIEASANFNDELGKLKGQAYSTFASFMSPALPWFTDQMTNIREWIAANKDTIDAFSKGLGRFFSVVWRVGETIFKVLAPAFKLIGAVVSPVLSIVGTLVEKLLDVIDAIVRIRDSAIGKIAGFFGFGGGDDPETVTVSEENLPKPMQPQPAEQAFKPMQPQSYGQVPMAQTVNNASSEGDTNNSFTIVQQPGEDGEALAEKVAAKMEEIEERKRRRQRGGMYDRSAMAI
ncbi:hypothetical protein [Sansalvadorimonas verongulae]|uniref:hypothetical protein n=1 Tax=Sansalvadorimonas verongulae TaxID=2172824 RepID=UPI0012BD257B|nr:hypothetical protein [Sansalvadorimonas verongulae]MTI13428.1 hypothetical protein [Sansalvadorimonas verongulae]